MLAKMLRLLNVEPSFLAAAPHTPPLSAGDLR
jgi:hypothetical protein